MRAAWGALKGAVQELNDVLLEDENEIQTDMEKTRNELKYSNEHLIKQSHFHDFDLTCTEKKHDNFGSKNGDKCNFELENNLYIDQSRKRGSSVSNVPTTYSVSSTMNKIVTGNKDNFNPVQKFESTSECKYINESYFSNKEELNGIICEDNFNEKEKNNICLDDEEVNLEYEEEINAGSEHELELINSEGHSLACSSEKDDYSIGTEELEYDEDDNANINNFQADTSCNNLSSKHVVELEKIFQLEIKTTDDLCRILEGYYSDWKGIINDLINNKELILKLTPPHYESYLRGTLFDNNKPFSLGFTVLLGQCIISFVTEIEKNNSKISDQKLNISKLTEDNNKLNDLLEKSEIEKSVNLKEISDLSKVINSLKEENERLIFILDNESNGKNEIDKKRIEELENERNGLIKNLNDMISEKENTKDEIDKLQEHINNLTSIIEGYQTEEDQINNRYEIELEKVRTNERKLISKLSRLESLQKEVENMKIQTEKLNNEKSMLEKGISELKENNKNLFDSNEEMIRQINSIKEEQREYMIDKRFIQQLIQKYYEEDSRPKYRNDLFNLLCDAIGIPEDEKSKYFASEPKHSKKSESNSSDLSQNIGFADMFYNFLNSEIEGNI
ncbi:hypothetical protein FG386_003257 [Cryptosporidium ryanae]|uniref:uncharacterized protein n=1 Tax=Cryptosporidium ryanae TaxID=515981 RepID=UPI00351A20B4|nr:hypothetical protein FG386_003257 [Cryptosporidium ryanae]